MLFNLYTEAILRNVNLENFEGVKIAGRNITNLRYADDTTLMAETKEDLMSLITNKTIIPKYLIRQQITRTAKDYLDNGLSTSN